VPEELIPEPEQGGGDLPRTQGQDGGGARLSIQVTMP
jgi:hypothetical protein